MKRYSWIFALIMALTMAFVFTGCPAGDDTDDSGGGGGGGGGSALPSTNGTGFTVNLVDKTGVKTSQDDIEVIPNAAATLGYLDDNSGYLYTYGTVVDSDFGNAIAYFKVDLGTDTLGDYEKVTFKWKAYGGDVASYKRLFLLATNTEADIEPYKGDAAIQSICVNASGGFNDADSTAPQMNGSEEQEVTLKVKKQTALSGEIYFAIYVHAQTGTYVIKDLEFLKWTSDPIAVTSLDYKGPTKWFPGVPLTLTEEVTPDDARNQVVVWTMKNAGTTGATINGDKLTATAAGTISLKATITDGLLTSDYTKDFDNVIEIVDLGTETLAGVTITGADSADTTVKVPSGGGGLVAATDGFTVNVTKDYGNSAAYFSVDLGTKTLADFEKITIKWKGNFGDIGYKQLFLLAASSEDGVKLPLVAAADDDSSGSLNQAAIKAIAVNADLTNPANNWWNCGPQVNGTTESSLDLSIVKGDDLTGIVWFAIFMYSEAYSATITDITFVE